MSETSSDYKVCHCQTLQIFSGNLQTEHHSWIILGLNEMNTERLLETIRTDRTLSCVSDQILHFLFHYCMSCLWLYCLKCIWKIAVNCCELEFKQLLERPYKKQVKMAHNKEIL